MHIVVQASVRNGQALKYSRSDLHQIYGSPGFIFPVRMKRFCLESFGSCSDFRGSRIVCSISGSSFHSFEKAVQL